MNSHQQIVRTSRRYRIILMFVFWMIPIIHGLLWLYIEQIPQHWVHQQTFEISGEITPLMKMLSFCVSMIKGGIVMYGIYILIHLFNLYERGLFFQAENVVCFRKLSQTIIWWVVAGLIVTPLLAVILTINNPPGSRAIQLSIESTDLTALIIGGILGLIASVMKDGQRLQEEADLTV